MSKIKNSGLDQYGAEPFEQQQFGTAGVQGVNNVRFCSLQCRVNIGVEVSVELFWPIILASDKLYTHELAIIEREFLN